MLSSSTHLADALLNPETVDQVATRDGFGKGVVRAGEEDVRVVVLCADLAESTRSHWFKEKFPERYVELGVAEQNMVTVARGMANYGKIPFVTSYAAFSPGRCWEQIRTTIALNEVPVKVMGMHAGVSVGPDGATHQPLEDMALMRSMPRMTVISPCDAVEAEKAVYQSAFTKRPIYIRFGREKTPVMTTEATPFEIGKANLLWEGENPEVALMATGALVYNALKAAEELANEGISTLVINHHTIKPMDEKAVLDAARRCNAVVSVEEHQVSGGMGSAIAEILAYNHPAPMEMIGVHDQFGQSGKPDELIEHYGMGVGSIKEAVHKVRAKKFR